MTDQTTPSQVDFSVIVPVYNDPAGIRTTLESLTDLTYPTESHEIVVVDNDSTDETYAVAASLASGHEHISVAVEEGVQSSYAARNTGVSHASGDVLAFIDADMKVPASWLTDLSTVFRETNADYVGCDVELFVPDGERRGLVARYNLAEGFPIERYMSELDYAPTCCMAVRRPVFDDVGPFTADLVSGEDVEFGRRVAQAGYAQRFAAGVTVYHPVRTTLGEMISKYVRHGRGREQRYQRYRDTKQSRPWYHPRNFLPLHPGRFYARMSGSTAWLLLPVFYLVAYVCKLARVWGQIRERFGKYFDNMS